MPITPEVTKAFDFASDATKQLITLSTGILTLTLTFATDIFEDVAPWVHTLLLASWGVYILSIMFGIGTLLYLTGQLEPVGGAATPSIRDPKLTRASGLQIVTFVLATVLIVISGSGALTTPNAEPDASQTISADRVLSLEISE